MCEFFCISRKTLSAWEKKGAPKERRGEWNIKKLMEWKYQNSALSPEARKIVAEADLKEAKAAQEKIKLCLSEERYMDAQEVSVHLKRLFTAIKQSLISLGHKVGAELNTIDPDAAADAKKIIDREVRVVMEEMANAKFSKSKKNVP